MFLTVGCQENEKQQNISLKNRNIDRNIDSIDIKSLSERANSILYQSLTNQNGVIRAHAIEVVSETGRNDLMPTVVKLLKDEKFGVRFLAAVTIGDMDYKQGALSVKPLLKDEQINVQIAAAYTLTKLRKENQYSLIIEQLKNTDQTVRANAALLIGKLGKKDAHEHLKWVLNDKESSYGVKVQATEALAMLNIDKKTTYQRLWTLLVSKFADDKISGINGMRLADTTNSRAAIKTMLTDEMPEIRLFAAEQLGRMSDSSGKNEVIQYFTTIRPTADEKSREQADLLAAMAIGRIGGPELIKYIPILLNSSNKDLQLRAAQAVLLLTK
ncbi:MAG: HEAT repeat domain-containing protein [Phycisphaerae bacterium]|nr:HEAT repeat domain-containing protein [Phycisphaerae bacterium]